MFKQILEIVKLPEFWVNAVITFLESIIKIEAQLHHNKCRGEYCSPSTQSTTKYHSVLSYGGDVSNACANNRDRRALCYCLNCCVVCHNSYLIP